MFLHRCPISLFASLLPCLDCHLRPSHRIVPTTWPLVPLQAMLDVVGELRHLCGLDGTAPKSPIPGRKSGRGGYTPRSVSPVSKGKRTSFGVGSKFSAKRNGAATHCDGRGLDLKRPLPCVRRAPSMCVWMNRDHRRTVFPAMFSLIFAGLLSRCARCFSKRLTQTVPETRKRGGRRARGWR